MKERLTGAIILVALIVLLVPELLTGPIRAKSVPPASATIASPSVAQGTSAETPLRSYTMTLGAAPSAGEAASAPAVVAPKQPAESAAQDASQSAATSSAATSAANPATSPATSPKEGANESPDEGRGAGSELQPATAPDDTGSRTERARPPRQAAATRSGLQAAKPPTHLVMREARSSASSPGWVVQLGSFASRGNADRLAHALAGRGFHMSVSPARAGSRVLWRVRAGPTHDRAGAQRLAARLRALGHRGEVLPVR